MSHNGTRHRPQLASIARADYVNAYLPQIEKLRIEAMYLAQGLTRPVTAGKKFPRDRAVMMSLLLTRLRQLGLYQGPITGGPLTPAMEAAVQRYMSFRGIPTLPNAPYTLAVARLIDESLYSSLVEHPTAPPRTRLSRAAPISEKVWDGTPPRPEPDWTHMGPHQAALCCAGVTYG